VSAPSGTAVSRLAPLAEFLQATEPNTSPPALGLTDPAWLRETTPDELRRFLSTAKERGLVGVVVLGSAQITAEAVHVFRQVKLFLGSAAHIRSDLPAEAAEFQLQLQAVLDRSVQQDRRRLAIVQQLLAAMNEENPLSALM